MAVLTSKTQLGGVVSDTFVDAFGTWTIERVFVDGVYAWELNQDSSAALDGATLLDELADVDTTTVAPSSGNFLVFDGTNWIPTSSSVSASLLNTSGGALDVPLPTAAGAGTVVLFANDDVQTNASTISVQAGESLNGVTDGTFITSNYDDGTQFIATDVGVGEWVVAVQGAATATDLHYYEARGVILDRDQSSSDESQNLLDFSALSTFTGASTDWALKEYDPASLRTSATELTIQNTGLYDLRIDVQHSEDNLGGANGQNEHTSMAVGYRINGLNPVRVGIDSDQNGGNEEYARGEELVELTAGDVLTIWFGDIGDTRGDEDFFVHMSLKQLAKTEVILAGMVETQELSAYHATASADVTVTANTDFAFGAPTFSEATGPNDLIDISSGSQLVFSRAGRVQIAWRIDLKRQETGGQEDEGGFIRLFKNGSVVDDSEYHVTEATASPGGGHANVSLGYVGTVAATDAFTVQVDGPNELSLDAWRLNVIELPNSSVANPGDVPVEDVKVLLGSGTGLVDGSTVTISDTWGNLAATYDWVEIQIYGTAGTNPYRQSNVIETANWVDDVASVFISDAVNLITVFDMDVAGNTLEVDLNGPSVTQATVLVYGIKPQKTVIAVDPTFTEAKTLHRASFRQNAAGNISTPSTTIGSGYDVLDLNDTDLIIYDPNGMFNLANNSVTIQQDGDYKIDWSVAVGGADNTVLIVDGVDVAWGRGEGAADTATINVVLSLTTGQTIEFGSDDTVGDSIRTSMSIVQLPTEEVVTPGDVPVEDVRVLLAEVISPATSALGDVLTGAGYASWLALAASGDFETIRIEQFENSAGGGTHFAAVGEAPVELFGETPGGSAATFYLTGRDGISLDVTATDVSSNTLTVNGSSDYSPPTQFTYRVYGIKAQKTVINTTDTPTDDQTASGYFDIGNMRMQWGSVPSGANAPTVTLPAPFADSSYTVTGASENNSATTQVSIKFDEHTTTTFRMIKASSNTDPARWMAIGPKP